MLDAALVREPIGDSSQARLTALEVFPEIESTNSYLLGQEAPPPGCFRVALAEHQTAGRGRFENRWHSAPGSGICLSIAYTFAKPPEDPAALTIAAGVGAVEALESLGLRGAGLKWPNDIIVADGKLGGILTEVHSSASGIRTVVVGIGINIDVRASQEIATLSTGIGRVSDLASALPDLPSRAAISAALIEQVFNALARFERSGLSGFLDAWSRLDWLRGQQVTIERPGECFDGVCEGIDADGALLVRCDGGRRRVLSGSVRPGRMTGVW
ncbi:MAG: biotin--[acetyl-CoA-carboxylase] ligase [Gammaproteobacteria bacterium]|nr:biotin--[acetyl-CoA-carboxylase] ligase [Gammaproteobacteria bacterium]MDH5345378.1 biotin--[acetyl-CoA-carboxylase] ligase [Gammaproteobacteria bacterium]